MPRRFPTVDPELRAHQEWLGYVQPVGLVVAPAAIRDAGWVLTRSGSDLVERQQRYRDALERLNPVEDADLEDDSKGFSRLNDLLMEHLGWSEDQVQSDPSQLEAYARALPELGESLKPTAVIPAVTGHGAQMLVKELAPLTPLDRKSSDGEHHWRATPQERFERLLRETGVEAGLLFNGGQLRLVVAPKGESSGHLTFPLQELAEVSGRLMFSGLDLLLGQSRVFFDPDGARLADVLKASRSFQAVVSNTLADQVLAALWDLLRGFAQADHLTRRQGKTLLGSMPDEDPQRLYGGLITVLMRLVFLLYAEDEALMPADAVYEQNYKVSGIFAQLQQDAAEFPDTMEQRYGAWAGLMSLCRLVFHGGGATADYLPARRGQLFDPGAYPWLDTPWLSDRVVLNVLRNLLVVNGERISYRALDVEQIGSVYEGIMGYQVRPMGGRCIGVKSKPQGAKKQLTTAIDLDELLALDGGQRKKWLEDQAQTSLPTNAVRALKTASSEGDVLEALASRIDTALFAGPQPAGSLVFQPTAERRRSGSHYTPRSLTRPIVEEALRPWLERCNHRPTAAQILELKICDPAMGSGAFLVETCRYLAELLEQAWIREGLPPALQPGGGAHGEETLIYARRLIAQSCLYGVDKNPFAVNLAKLSLWLVTLSKDAPFTFVDHALKCGDSLVGYGDTEISDFFSEVQLAFLDEQLKVLPKLSTTRQTTFGMDSRDDATDRQKRQELAHQEESAKPLKLVGDLMVAAFFSSRKPKERKEKARVYAAMAGDAFHDEGLDEAVQQLLNHLKDGEHGITPFHWQLEFPEVFSKERSGFDAFVGNPPFAGKNTIAQGSPAAILDWFKHIHEDSHGNADLVAHFFRRCFDLLRPDGGLGLVATNTIAQGDTRSTGLRWICTHGGTITAARKRTKWPGVAAVVVSVVHLLKGTHTGRKWLDGQPVGKITAFLFANGDHDDPKPLAANAGKSFVGSTVFGLGFTFNDSSDAGDETSGTPSPIKTMERLIAEDPKNQDVIFPLIGSEEVNNSPTHAYHRYVINFGGRREEECWQQWPELMKIVEQKVKPGRIVLPPKNAWNKQVAAKWWLFGADRKELALAIDGCERVLVCPGGSTATKHFSFAFLSPNQVYLNTLCVFSLSTYYLFALLTSRLHDNWSRFNCATLGDGLRYNSSACFETFPFPVALLDHLNGNQEAAIQRQALESTGKNYYQFRAALMVENNEGLTKTYNRFHDPEETDSQIMELRRLHGEMDQAVLNAYGWRDVPTTCCGFGLDYLDVNEDAQLPDELQDRIDTGSLFFRNAEDAVAFQAQLKAHGAISAKKKLPWRYRWPDAVRDDVLARLLALNAERYAEEVAQGLHSDKKKSGEARGKPGRRRGRPPKTPQSSRMGSLDLR
ncbi:MAG: N-6 DNA methylase [Synechococcus sp. SB0667_bin_8]|nr:N-6 DNA methylase [Synechococcus sp. SB0667_bin_8]